MHVDRSTKFVYNMTPFDIGVQDARTGQPCRPSQYFSRREQRAEYVAGFASVSRAVAIVTMHGTDAPARPVVHGSIDRCRPFARVKASGYTGSDNEPGKYERL